MSRVTSSYRSPHNQTLAGRVRPVVDAPAHEPVSDRQPISDTSAAPVSDAVKPVTTGARRTARWRAKQDPAALKRKNREAAQRLRAKPRPAREGDR
jgi:hypothetical protein